MARSYFRIPYGHEIKHAAALSAGLACLPSGFSAVLCEVCNGHGQYEQTYTAGCGGGYFRMKGACNCCEETGLLQNGRPAPISVIHQVLNAGTAAKDTPHD